MSPHYEDAAHLLRFLVSGGLGPRADVSYQRLIERIAAFMEVLNEFPPETLTHAEHAELLLASVIDLAAWDQRRHTAKLRAIAATTIGNHLTNRSGPVRHTA